MTTSEEFDELFNDYEPPPPEILLEPCFANKPSRVQQLLSKLQSDEANLPDGPNEFETPEWEEDFEFKASTLRDAFQQTVTEELYIELFGSLESKCHLLLNEQRKWTAKSFHELEQHIQENDHVFLYNQVFENRAVDPETGEVIWYPKTYDALIGFRCFVVDIDHVDARNIRSVIEMIKSKPILPNYINLTGNGLHLYFLFDALHDLKHSTWRMAKVNETTSESERETYVVLKQKMIAWYSSSTAKSDTDNHLAQPSRLPGSKTKNRNKQTILFKVSDIKYSIQHIAGLFGIDLPDEESIRRWKKKVNADRRKWKKEQKVSASKPAPLQDFFGSDEPESRPESRPETRPEPMLVVEEVDDNVCGGDCEPGTVNVNSKYRFSFDGLAQRISEDWDGELNCPRNKFYEELKKLRAEKKAKAATPESQKRRIAQRRGLESQYEQFTQYCRDVAQYGKRRLLLHIFWNHAPWYQKDQIVIQRDFDDLFLLCNSLHHTEITKQQYNSIVTGPSYKYTKKTISDLLCVELKFKNKKNDKLKYNRDANDNMWKRIYVICESTLKINPRCGWEHLLNTVNSYGMKVCDKTLRTRSEIKELKARMRSQ